MLSRESCKYTFSKGKPSKFLNSFGRGFVMASLNINSLLAIDETKLDSSIGDSEISLPGFEVVRRDRPVAVFEYIYETT